MNMRKEWAKGHGHQWQIQQSILVKVTEVKLLDFSIPRLFFKFRELSFFEGAKQSFEEQ